MARYFALVDQGEDGAYGVVVHDLPGCTAMGDTLDEALASAVEAMGEWADYKKDHGGVPDPRNAEEFRADPRTKRALSEGAILTSLPLIYETGKNSRVNISVDAGSLRTIDEEAKKRGDTRSSFLIKSALKRIAEEV